MNGFEKFLLKHKTDLKRIARHSHGEHQYEDVVNEDRLMAERLRLQRGIAVDFANEDFRKLLLSHLYQHLVRYTEQHVRRAIRLNHGAEAGDGQAAPNPLANRLASENGSNPLSFLLASEEASLCQLGDNRFSLAAAYVVLLQRFGNRMCSVANHLLISRSHAYRCCARARLLAEHQVNIALILPSANRLGPWRKYRVPRVQKQLAFDFDEKLDLPARSIYEAPRRDQRNAAIP
mgnify:CR=1 FL=1